MTDTDLHAVNEPLLLCVLAGLLLGLLYQCMPLKGGPAQVRLPATDTAATEGRGTALSTIARSATIDGRGGNGTKEAVEEIGSVIAPLHPAGSGNGHNRVCGGRGGGRRGMVRGVWRNSLRILRDGTELEAAVEGSGSAGSPQNGRILSNDSRAGDGVRRSPTLCERLRSSTTPLHVRSQRRYIDLDDDMSVLHAIGTGVS